MIFLNINKTSILNPFAIYVILSSQARFYKASKALCFAYGLLLSSAAHSWMENGHCAAQETPKQDNQVCNELEADGGSFSTFISRSQDYSFSGQPSLSDERQLCQSPAFTCKSSFFSFQVDDNTHSASGRFSFSSCRESSAAECSPLIPLMPSFTFFSPISIEQGNLSLGFKADIATLDVIYGGMFFLSFLCVMDEVCVAHLL